MPSIPVEEQEVWRQATFNRFGPIRALVLLKLLTQLPTRSIGTTKWIVPDDVAVLRVVHLANPALLYQIYNELAETGVIEKKINKKIKKLVIKFNFAMLAELYNNQATDMSEEIVPATENPNGSLENPTT